jgi:hypothetical protein
MIASYHPVQATTLRGPLQVLLWLRASGSLSDAAARVMHVLLWLTICQNWRLL